MPQSLAEFTRQIEATGLIDSEAISAFVSTLCGDGPLIGSEQLARELVRQKMLTRYQVEQIYSGKGESLVLGNYVILDKLGQGGMGMVLKAEHKRMKRLVALKVMSAAALKTPDALKRFHREVEAAAKLRHPHIVAADDADEAKGTHFLVMEYVEGSDLSALVKKQGVFSVEKAIVCILQAARGLEFAHQEGVIHRDIKPANLLLDTKGTVKILDMGLARIEGDAGHQSELTSSGAVMGTVDYMAPEQALSTKTADARSDIYSLGISLWYLLTGRCAYDGDSLMSKLLAHRDQPVPSLRGGPEVSATVDAVFRKMVAKRSADRYQSMTEVIKDLEGCLSGSPLSIDVSIPQTSDDALLSAFLSNLNTSTGTSTAVATSRTSQTPLVETESANAATIVAGNLKDAADRNTVSTSGAFPDRPIASKAAPSRNRAAPSAWWKNRAVIIGAGIAPLVIGLVWSQFPTGRDSAATTVKQPPRSSEPKTETEAPTNAPKDSAEKRAIDWLFSVGAIVGVGHPGGVETFPTTEEILASGKPVVYVILPQQSLSENDLAHLPALPSIHSLNLSSCEMSDRAVLPIGELSQLGILNLSHTKVTDRCLPYLLKCRSLQSLHLGGTEITTEGLETIGKMWTLTELVIDGVPVTRRSLSQLQNLRLLRNLNLGRCPNVTDDFGSLLVQFPLLEILYLGDAQLGDRGLLDLSKSPNLLSLHLNHCTMLTDECGEILSQFSRLQTLELASAPIGDRVLEGIRKLKTLQSLSLYGTKVSDVSIPSLSQMKALVWLDIRDTAFTVDGVKQLAAGMPWCHIESSHGTFAPTDTAASSSGAALEFDGVGSRVELPLIPFALTDSLTIEAWFTAEAGPKPNITDVESNTDAVWSMVNPSTKVAAHFFLDRPNAAWWLGAGDDHVIRTSYYWFTRVDKRKDLYGVRHHAAFVREGDEVRVYVDGQPQRSGGAVVDYDKTPPDPAFRPSEVDQFFLGAAVGPDGKSLTRFLQGAIDEFRLSKSVRYSDPFVPEQEFESDANTLALFHFDEGTGDMLLDSSGNNFHGKIVGAKWVKLEGSTVSAEQAP